MIEEQTTEEEATELDEFPVSFCVIATLDHFKDNALHMIRSLPANAQICVLFNQEGKEEQLSELEIKTEAQRTLRSKMWTYKAGEFSFAKARNLCDELATKDWIFWIDCDELLAQAQHDGIAEATKYGGGVGGFSCGQASYTAYEKLIGNGASPYINTGQLRLYRNKHGFQWIGHAHEQIATSIKSAGYSVIDTTITIIHNGYSVDESQLISKLERNTSLIGRWLQENIADQQTDLWKFYRDLYARDIQGLIKMEKLQCQSRDM